MTKSEFTTALKALDNAAQQRWMFNFGYQLTISARDFYESDGRQATAKAMVGFNEIQHRIYGRTAVLERSETWTEDSYIEGVLQMAEHYEIVEQVGWALRKAVESTPA